MSTPTSVSTPTQVPNIMDLIDTLPNKPWDVVSDKCKFSLTSVCDQFDDSVTPLLNFRKQQRVSAVTVDSGLNSNEFSIDVKGGKSTIHVGGREASMTFNVDPLIAGAIIADIVYINVYIESINKKLTKFKTEKHETEKNLKDGIEQAVEQCNYRQAHNLQQELEKLLC